LFALIEFLNSTNEPPTGMQANLHKALDLFNQDTLEMCAKETEFKSILFALCYFHAVVAERSDYINNIRIRIRKNFRWIFLDENLVHKVGIEIIHLIMVILPYQSMYFIII
jgi:hypothetical protein